MKKLLTIVIVGLLSSFNGSALAQDASTDFNIRFGGEDIFPPTTPVLSATATSPTQVDLTWSTSTDNFSLAGYRIFRSGEFVATTTIATTTLQFYSDSGLAASTTFNYQVQAFDNSFNFSSTSNTVTITTPDFPVVPLEVSDGTADSGVARVVIKDLKIETGLSTSSIRLVTAFPARIEFRWGKVDDFELGYIVSASFKSENRFFLEGLEPATTYRFEIVGFNYVGKQFVLANDLFTTNSPLEKINPINVKKFTGTLSENDVRLSWEFPNATEADYVRIVRSHLGYPAFPTDGALIYQGLDNSFVDEDILSDYSTIYYTAFLFDKFGNVSSGAITYVSNDSQNTFSNTDGIDVGGAATVYFNPDRIKPDMKMPDLSSIEIRQDGQIYSMLDSPLNINSSDEVTISIPANSVSGNLKSIITSVVDPTDNKKTYSFLLRINKEKTAYEATFKPFGVIGSSQLKVEIYDYETFVVASYKAPISFSTKISRNNPQVVFPDIVFDPENSTLVSTVVLIFVLLSLLLFWRIGGVRITNDELRHNRRYS